MPAKPVPAPAQWANFITGAMDWRAEPPAHDGEARAYIPQDAETQARYAALRDAGQTPPGAIRAIVTQALETWHPPRPCPVCYPAPCTCWRSAPGEQQEVAA